MAKTAGTDATALGARLRFLRIESLNADPDLIEALAAVARRTLEAGQLALLA
jgi:hypothetical protein